MFDRSYEDGPDCSDVIHVVKKDEIVYNSVTMPQFYFIVHFDSYSPAIYSFATLAEAKEHIRTNPNDDLRLIKGVEIQFDIKEVKVVEIRGEK